MFSCWVVRNEVYGFRPSECSGGVLFHLKMYVRINKDSFLSQESRDYANQNI